jgi:hypothetical protein
MGYSKHSSSAARFTHLAGKRITDETGSALVNDTIDKESGAILRFKNGMLDGGSLPAVECTDFHMEFYRKGKLHRDEGPAVLSDGGKIKEFWKDGVRQS